MKKLSKPHGMIAQHPAPPPSPAKIKAPPALKENSPKIETNPPPFPPRCAPAHENQSQSQIPSKPSQATDHKEQVAPQRIPAPPSGRTIIDPPHPKAKQKK